MVELRPRRMLEGRIGVGEALQIGVAQFLEVGAREIVADVGCEQTQRGGDPGIDRNHETRNADFRRDVEREQRPRSPERNERELPGVVALAHAVHLDGLDHVVARDLDRAERRLLHRHAERPGELRLQGRAREAGIERDPAAEMLLRADSPERELTVRDRRLGARPDGSRPGPAPPRRSSDRPGTGRLDRHRRSIPRRRRWCRRPPSAPWRGSRQFGCRAHA